MKLLINRIAVLVHPSAPNRNIGDFTSRKFVVNNMKMNQILHMEGGEGDFSYTNNSLVQVSFIEFVKMSWIYCQCQHIIGKIGNGKKDSNNL